MCGPCVHCGCCSLCCTCVGRDTLPPARSVALKSSRPAADAALYALPSDDTDTPHYLPVVLVLAGFLVVERALQGLTTAPSRRSEVALAALRNSARVVGSNELLVWTTAIVALWVSVRLSWWMVPECTLPHAGWPVFLAHHVLGVWIAVRLLAFARGDATPPSLSLLAPILGIMVCACVCVCVCLLRRWGKGCGHRDARACEGVHATSCTRHCFCVLLAPVGAFWTPCWSCGPCRRSRL
jgi:hypothetical protein